MLRDDMDSTGFIAQQTEPLCCREMLREAGDWAQGRYTIAPSVERSLDSLSCSEL